MVFSTPRVLLLALASALVANAAIYVTQPSAGSTCHGGKACDVSWLDDGQEPLLSSIGVTRMGLYTADLRLVQTIQPVNVSSTRSLTFTPNPKAGPNSGSYYIAFIPASDSTYRGYTPWFSLDNMSGSFASPDPAATSSLPLPSTSGLPTETQTTTAETTGSRSGSASATPSSVSLTASTETSATSGATEATSSGFTTVRATSSGTTSGTASGASSGSSSGSSSRATSSGTSTGTSTSSTATPFNAAVPNSVPATGFVWTLLVFFGATLL